MDLLRDLMRKKVLVYLVDGRIMTGIYNGMDWSGALSLTQVEERGFTAHGTMLFPLGTLVLRGDSVAVVGEWSAEKERGLGLGKRSLAAAPPQYNLSKPPRARVELMHAAGPDGAEAEARRRADAVGRRVNPTFALVPPAKFDQPPKPKGGSRLRARYLRRELGRGTKRGAEELGPGHP